MGSWGISAAHLCREKTGKGLLSLVKVETWVGFARSGTETHGGQIGSGSSSPETQTKESKVRDDHQDLSSLPPGAN